MEEAKLYGDGLHDDTQGIQALLDARTALVDLPAPEVCYLISKTLVIHSNQELRLPRLATIRLADGSNCLMLRNEAFDAEPTAADENVAVTGGIWDYNNRGQLPHPWHFPHDGFPDYDGLCICLRHVRGLHLTGMTLKDPMTFAVTLDFVSYFSVEDITFDFNYGHPWAINMDGVHLDGNCHYGSIRDLRGSCYDDLVALNADEGTHGPITNVDIDGIFSEDCHSAVRLLSCDCPVKNVHIRNVYGTYYQYCIGVTKFYDGPSEGYFDGLVFDNLFASKAERKPVYRKDGMMVYPLIWFEEDVTVRNVTVSNVFRVEERVKTPTVCVEKNATVENMLLDNVVQENRLGEPFPLLENNGTIRRLSMTRPRTYGDPLISGDGVIEAGNADLPKDGSRAETRADGKEDPGH